MNQRIVEGVSFSLALAVGLAISTGYPFGFVAVAGMPVLCLMPGSRKSAFRNTLTYYLAGLWPMIPSAQRYIGQPSSLCTAVLIWACSAVLLSVPWTFAWIPHRPLQYLWRVPAANMALIIPPLGLIGFISPLTGAGYIFPGTSWLGLAATVLLPGIVLALARQPVGLSRTNLRIALSALMSLALGAHILVSAQVEIPANWEAVNTNFGDLSDPYRDFLAAQSIQQHVAASKARVMIFPESVVPHWSDATKEFWRSTLLASRIRGQIVAIGAGRFHCELWKGHVGRVEVDADQPEQSFQRTAARRRNNRFVRPLVSAISTVV